MKKIRFILGIFILFFCFACTNSEMEFPSEDKKKEKKADTKNAQIYKTPTLFLLPAGLEMAHLYYFISLARLNGAETALFLPLDQYKLKTFPTKIKELYSYHSKKVAIVSFDFMPKLVGIDKNIVEKVLVISSKPYPVDNKIYFNIVYKPQVKQKNAKVKMVLTDSTFLKSGLKHTAFLSQMFEKIIGKKPLASLSKEEILYIKGFSFPLHFVNLYELSDGKEILTFQSKVDKEGFFPALIANPSKPFSVAVYKKEKKIWHFYLKDCAYSFSFFDFRVPENLLAEVHSYFKAINLNQVVFPKSIVVPKEFLKPENAVYSLQFIKSDKIQIKKEGEVLKIFLPQKAFPFNFEMDKQKLRLNKESSLLIF